MSGEGALLHMSTAASPNSCGGYKTIVPCLCIHQDISWMSKDNDISNNTTYRLNRQMWDRLLFVPLSPCLAFSFCTLCNTLITNPRTPASSSHTRSQSCFSDWIRLIRENKRLSLGPNILMNGSERRFGRNGCCTGRGNKNIGFS